MINLTVKQFADHYIPNYTKVRIIKNFHAIFEGTLEELYYARSDVLSNIVSMVGADDNYLCLNCRTVKII